MNVNARIAALEQLAADRLRVPVAIDINRLTPDERERLGELEAGIVDVDGVFDFGRWNDADLNELGKLYTAAGRMGTP